MVLIEEYGNFIIGIELMALPLVPQIDPQRNIKEDLIL